MSDRGPAYDLQIAIIAQLNASSALVALVGDRIYDQPPDNAALPYVRLGRMDLRPFRDTVARDHDVIFSIEAHSPPSGGRAQAGVISSLVDRILDGSEVRMAVSGHSLDWCLFDNQSITQASNSSFVGVSGFSAMMSDLIP